MPPWVWLPNRTTSTRGCGTPRATSAMLLDPEANATAAVPVSNRFDRLRDQTDAPATEARAGPVATQAPDSVTTIRGTSYLGNWNVRGMKIASNIMKAVNPAWCLAADPLRSAGDLMDP
jgi:hypothetical protein